MASDGKWDGISRKDVFCECYTLLSFVFQPTGRRERERERRVIESTPQAVSTFPPVIRSGWEVWMGSKQAHCVCTCTACHTQKTHRETK